MVRLRTKAPHGTRLSGKTFPRRLKPVLEADKSALLRDQLLSELARVTLAHGVTLPRAAPGLGCDARGKGCANECAARVGGRLFGEVHPSV
jgi:hypothetical protein